MLRHTHLAVTVLVLGTIAAPAVQAAEQRGQDWSVTEKQESALDRMERATNSAGERVKTAANTAARELSDTWITLRTKLNLLTDGRVSSTDVHVTTQQRVVALRGKVANDDARNAAEEDARNIDGVRGVENHLTVSTATPKTPTAKMTRS